MNIGEHEEETSDVSVSLEKVNSARAKRRAARAAAREAALIKGLIHEGEETTACVSSCRFGEIRHTWTECLDACVDNVFMRSTMAQMLPSEEQGIKALDAAVPHGLDVPDAETQRILLKRRRSAEL